MHLHFAKIRIAGMFNPGNNKNKLCKQSGETITETLVSLLIAAIALTMLAGAISAASGMITKSRKKVNTYQDKIESIIHLPSSAPDGIEKSQPNVVFQEVVENGVTATMSIPSESVTYYETSEFTDKPVAVYKK